MSALARHRDQAARRRLRRANAGTITEMTRSLLYDAREVAAAEARRRTQDGDR
jgi:hypothetical protein